MRQVLESLMTPSQWTRIASTVLAVVSSQNAAPIPLRWEMATTPLLGTSSLAVGRCRMPTFRRSECCLLLDRRISAGYGPREDPKTKLRAWQFPGLLPTIHTTSIREHGILQKENEPET